MKKIISIFMLWFISIHARSASKGYLDLTIFSQGNSVKNQLVHIKSIGDFKSNENGQILIDLAAGQYELSITYQGTSGKSSFEIRANQLTVAAINVAPNLLPRFSIENPIGSQEEAVASITNNKHEVHLQGRLLSLTDHQKIKGAQVFVRGYRITARSDDGGNFTLNLSPGTYNLSIIHPRYSTLNINEFIVPEGGKTHVFTMSPAGVRLDDFVVTAPHIRGSLASLMDERRLSAEVVDVLGSEQMSKAGDSDAASAIRRVTGLTVQSGKYPFIRGMGGRYVTTQLNGFNLPSPDPSKRVVPLDMFPTGLLEGISVVKSTSSDRLGEFGGGHILLKTKTIPEDFFLKMSMSTSMANASQEALTYKGGETDWLGIDDGTRKLPAPLAVATSGNRELQAYSELVNPTGLKPEEFERLGESLPDIYNIDHVSQPVSKGISLSTGGSLGNPNHFQVGLTASALYGDDWDTTSKFQANYPGGILDKFFDITETERLVKAGASASVGMDIEKNHKIKSFVSILRRTTDQTTATDGEANDWDGPAREYTLKWQERQMIINQLWGEHTLPFLSDLTLAWRVGSANAELYQPDTREYRYEKNNDRFQFATTLGSNKRNFAELYDTNKEVGFDLELPISINDSFNMKFKTGAMQIDKTRKGKTRRFGFKLNGSVDADTLAMPLEDILTSEFIGNDGFTLNELTQKSDAYSGNQTIDAAYGMWETNLFDTYSVSLGVRNESSVQHMNTYALFDPNNEPAVAKLETNYLLPSFNSTVKIDSQSQVRLSFSKSVARPDFRELSPTPYIDDETGYEIKGNPDLLTTEIDALDIRYEWYGNANESLSIAGFVKNLKNPIEITIVPGTFQKEYGLAKSADILGLELEWHQNLSRISRSLSNFKAGGNLTYMSSGVKLLQDQIDSGIQTNSKRPLQGQSPYVINLYLFYDNLRTHSQFGLLFNQLGKRISGIGTLGASDAYLLPTPQLDMTFSQKLFEHYKLGLKIKNLLKSAAKEKQDGFEISRTDRPREYSMSLSASF